MSERDSLEYDVAIVGAGPAGLACAIRLRQLDASLRVCVLEKAASIGAHALSGAILDPGPLDALLPQWREQMPEICLPVAHDEFCLLTRRRSLRLPTPPPQRNHGNFIISLCQLLGKLGAHAESIGIDVFSGFAAAEPLYDANGAVSGVRLADMGRLRDGSEGPSFSPGADIRATCTIVAEGCRGSLSKVLIRRFGLDADRSPPSYGLGFKELWQLPPGRTRPGLVQHTVGWPLPSSIYGGGFVYHLNADRVYIGLVVGLDYLEPTFQPFEAFQQFKHHPTLLPLLEGGEPIGYGARAIAAGGAQALPRLEMPGAMLIGDAAGTLNVARLKGIHQAMRCGVLAAEHWVEARSPAGFDQRWRQSVGGRELQRVRNIKPAFKHGLWVGLANAALETAFRDTHPGRCSIGPTTSCIASSTVTSRAAARPPLRPETGSHGRFRRAIARPRCTWPRPHTKSSNRYICTCAIPLSASTAARANTPIPARAFVPLPSMRSSLTPTDSGTCRSTPPIASTARPATSRIPTRSSLGPRRKAARVPTIRTSSNERHLLLER